MHQRYLRASKSPEFRNIPVSITRIPTWFKVYALIFNPYMISGMFLSEGLLEALGSSAPDALGRRARSWHPGLRTPGIKIQGARAKTSFILMCIYTSVKKIYIYIHIYVHMCNIYIYRCIYICTYVCAYVQIQINTYMHVFELYTYLYIYTHAYNYTKTYSYIYIYKDIPSVCKIRIVCVVGPVFWVPGRQSSGQPQPANANARAQTASRLKACTCSDLRVTSCAENTRCILLGIYTAGLGYCLRSAGTTRTRPRMQATPRATSWLLFKPVGFSSFCSELRYITPTCRSRLRNDLGN